ncbi:selenocysteine-specific elongation factor [Toxorhynchites rutilus septentrionalis]|uniref:selenocysteine-specific elongation factor n=1 Tax=Toxorhynchites rutilus septentrionalis TaxID=329112 RepID=UPI00247AA441|nr:selenocysteine-specific elongation factor [Toxorhynchites rutilus septentrionalis]
MKVFNLNVGILGHVDSGKTTLAKALSSIPSTAAFDKNPQSQQRGITLDLGFSALVLDLPDHFRENCGDCDKLQFTFVDCPGHSSLIRTIIGGAQIIDMMILVVDIGKGIQTQTAECLVICELTCRKIIIVLNKVDTVEIDERPKVIQKRIKNIRKILGGTDFTGCDIVALSAASGEKLETLVTVLQKYAFVPERQYDSPFLFAVDHCFAIKGQGTVCTGTVLQGQVKLNEDVEIPKLKLVKKVKSMQMFKQNLNVARQGDRIGICITQFDPKLLERGTICKPGYVLDIHAAILRLHVIKYYKAVIKSSSSAFNVSEQYKYLCETNPDGQEQIQFLFALLEFEKPVQATQNALIIGSKLDTDIHANQCRIAFYGHLDFIISDKNYATSLLPQLKLFKAKEKVGTIQRVVSETELIAAGLFKKVGNNRQDFIGFKAQLCTGEWGIIADTFGATSKVRLRFSSPLTRQTLDLFVMKDKQMKVLVRYKKYIFKQKNGVNKIVQ